MISAWQLDGFLSSWIFLFHVETQQFHLSEQLYCSDSTPVIVVVLSMSRPKVIDVHCGLSSGVYSFTREPKWSHSALSLVLLCFHGNHVRPRAGPKKTGPFLLPSVALLSFCCRGEGCQCGTKRHAHLHNHHAALCFSLRVIFLKPHCDMCGPYTFMLQILSSLTLVTHVHFVQPLLDSRQETREKEWVEYPWASNLHTVPVCKKRWMVASTKLWSFGHFAQCPPKEKIIRIRKII